MALIVRIIIAAFAASMIVAVAADRAGVLWGAALTTLMVGGGYLAMRGRGASRVDAAAVRDPADRDDIEQLALFDTVTGLPNRNYFRTRCETLVAAVPADGTAALLFLDLDRFKAVNDTLGHGAGDLLLAQVAERMRVAVEAAAARGEPEPLIGRLAGDEFTVFLPRTDHGGEAERVAQAILAALAQPFEVNRHTISVGASIGVALCPIHGATLTELMKAADGAMYQAKASGRGRVEVFGSALAERLSARAVLDQELRTAVAGNQFELMFQPQVAAATGRLVAVEALLRWWHPTRGMILPAGFIDRAEENGAIVPIGEWVVDTVTATIARWHRAGSGQRLSINLSERQLEQAGFFRRLHAALETSGAPAHLLELELGESLAMRCSDDILAALADLRAAGVSIAVDDFGTGYSNLQRLRGLPIDRIKLDRSMIVDVVEDAGARTIAQALIGLIHGLGCEAVAEGVEQHAQAEVLRVIGCDAIQGYAIARPMDEAGFVDWARAAQPVARVSTAA